MRVEIRRTVPLSYLRKLSWGAYNKRLQAEWYSRRCGAWVVGWSTNKRVGRKKSALCSQSKTRNIYKISLDGALTLGMCESVWLDNLFPLLTVVLEKSTAERCWNVVLTGCCCRETCRGQCPKYKQTLECIGASGHWKQTIKKARINFNPLVSGATGQINTWRSGSAGFLYTGWNTSSQ